MKAETKDFLITELVSGLIVFWQVYLIWLLVNTGSKVILYLSLLWTMVIWAFVWKAGYDLRRRYYKREVKHE